MPEAESAQVRLVHVTKRFADTAGAAVDDVSLAVPRGSFTTLLGPSGCGKTTTLRLIAGFYEPDAGDIFLGERRVNAVPVHRRRAAMVFQDYALFPHMSVEENVGYGLRLARLPRAAAQARVRDTLGFLKLTGLERRYPSQLSGGQQQRVALARALVMEPEVLLLDEPLSNLDAKLRVSIRGELIGIQRQLGVTTLYVTHDQEEALAMSDWVAVMNHGQVVQWGTPWEVYYRPRTPFMADFLGSVNLVPSRVLRTGPGLAVVELGGQGVPVAHEDAAGLTAEQAVLLSIRPESLALANAEWRMPNDGPPVEGGLALPGRVVGRTFLGHLMRYVVQAGSGVEWLVDQPDPDGAALFEGEVVIVVNPRRIHLISERDG